MVAEYLQRGGLGTLLFDLLTEAETQTRANVFDIPLLADRLEAATAWATTQPELAQLPIGYFGASTGAAAALVAAAKGAQAIAAVVSRGGRPDLAGPALAQVAAPTLLIVGGNDEPVIGLNRMALDQLTGPKRLVIIPGATHLFEEPGTLEEVARVAEEWFLKYLGGVKG
jgi:putative phosphoribosyl transferase